MKDHPEFLDSMKQFVAKRLAEWELENPHPVPSPEDKPEATIPMVCKAENGDIVITREGQKSHIYISTPDNRIILYLEEHSVKNLIENLLDVQCDMASCREWRQGGEPGAEWAAKKSVFVSALRQEFVSQYEHRYSAIENAEEIGQGV